MRQPFSTLTFALIASIGATGLTACAGFQPMHATPQAQMAFTDMSVTVSDGADENDRLAAFMIRQRLSDRINPGDTPNYRLMINPTSQRVGIGLTGQDLATRFDGVVTADWRLVRQSNGEQIASGRARSVATYSADQDPFRLQTTADQATERAARNVADELIKQIALELAGELAGQDTT